MMLMLEIVLGRVLPWVFAGLGYWFLYQLVRQNGRILVRLEGIEKRLPPRAGGKSREARGLPLGLLAPDFELPDLAGAGHSLKEFRG